ncbi:MAG: OadG family protein [Clostridia bacterium]|nr:OadG family protein [Clostridia bacterium]
MSLSEAVREGLMVTGVGLIIVFSVLIILMITMMIMKKVFYKEDAKKVKATENATTAASVAAPVAMENRQFAKEVKDENTLIAIFASAIAASLDTQVGSIKVHSYRCISDDTSKGK